MLAVRILLSHRVSVRDVGDEEDSIGIGVVAFVVIKHDANEDGVDPNSCPRVVVSRLKVVLYGV